MSDASNTETNNLDDNNQCVGETEIKNDDELSKETKSLHDNGLCEPKLETKIEEDLNEKTRSSHHDNQFEIKKDTDITNNEIKIDADIANNCKLKDVPIDETDSVATSQTPNSEFSDEHVTYTDDGVAIYTCPETNYKYEWSTEEEKWVFVENPPENEHFTWCADTKQWKPKNPETEHYKWNTKTNSWELKETKNEIGNTDTKTDANASSDSITYGVDENGHRTYTDKDGAVFFWDTSKKAWFPKIDDDFMARYQMNYGFIDNTSESEEERRKKEAEEAKRKDDELKRMEEEIRTAMATEAQSTTGDGGLKRKGKPDPPKWFDMDPEHNTKVYVSNLPLDINLEEFAELMGKCGLIMRDPQTQKYKLKLYTEADGQIKGDGLCDYIKIESVDLALNILDEYILRGNKIRVQRAEFQMRGEYNPALKPKKKKKDKEKLLKMKEKLFDWRPEKLRGERTKNEKVVMIKNLFVPETFEKDVQLILEYTNDLREECNKCGTVRKVIIYDRHPEGVAQINMSTPEEADLVIQMMNGRFFGKRQLSADYWDGKTKYKINESETEVKQRLSNWDEFLETEEEKQTST